jgi:hypothetical protein
MTKTRVAEDAIGLSLIAVGCLPAAPPQTCSPLRKAFARLVQLSAPLRRALRVLSTPVCTTEDHSPLICNLLRRKPALGCTSGTRLLTERNDQLWRPRRQQLQRTALLSPLDNHIIRKHHHPSRYPCLHD